MSLVGNGGAAFGRLPGLKLPSMASGSYQFNPPTAAALSPYSTPTFKVQSATPGATALGSQIDMPGGTGGYASGPNQDATRRAIASQLGVDNQDAQVQDFVDQYTKMMTGDDTYNRQLAGLNSGLQNFYSSNVLAPAQQAEIAYGGTLPGDKDFSSFAAPHDLSGNSFSQSLASALSDPTVAQNASANPYSDLALIQRQLDLANQGADANAVARGLGFSGEINQHHNENLDAAGQARYTAQGNFLGQLTNAYNGWLNQLSSAGNTLGGYQGDLSNRVMALINAGILSANNSKAEMAAKAAAAANVAQTRAPTIPNNQGAYPINAQQQTPQGGFDYGIQNFESDIPADATATSLEATTAAPNSQGVYPANNSMPSPISILANWSGGSANKKQGVFSIH